MERFLMTSVRDAEHFLMIKNISLFICNSFFFLKEEGGEFEQFIAFENETQCLVLLCRMRVGKKQENSWERVKSWSQSKIAAEILKITIDRTQWVHWIQMCYSQLPHPWAGTQRCCRGCSPVCIPCTKVCPRGKRSLSLKAASGHLRIKVPKPQVSSQPSHSLHTLGSCQRRLSLGTLQSHSH